MKQIIAALIILTLSVGAEVFAKENIKSNDFNSIGFHKKSEVPAELQIRKIFDDYQKYTNSKNLEGFLNLHDSSYRSADGYNIERLKELALEAWKEYPDVKYTVKVMSVNVDLDYATVITKERMSGITNASLDYIRGNGYIDSDSTSIYYLKRFSNDWRITSDFVINEKASMRYGVARLIPMSLDAPGIVGPNEEYTAIIKMNIPESYIALVSINNEPITFPLEKSKEVFRTIKPDGIRERILTSNDGSKNENAIASIGIAKNINNDDGINIDLVGIAFLYSRVNVVNNKPDNVSQLTQTKVEAKITKPDNTKGKK